jgi:hypothetical protein
LKHTPLVENQAAASHRSGEGSDDTHGGEGENWSDATYDGEKRRVIEAANEAMIPTLAKANTKRGWGRKRLVLGEVKLPTRAKIIFYWAQGHVLIKKTSLHFCILWN